MPIWRASCPLATAPLNASGGAERGRAGFHVDVRGERPVHHRSSGPDELRQCDGRHRFHVLQDQRTRQGHRGHCPRQCERGHRDRLAESGEVDDAQRHRHVEQAWRVGVDRREHSRLGGELLVTVDAESDLHEVEAVANTSAPAGVDEGCLVTEGHRRPVRVQMSHVDRDVSRLDGRHRRAHDVEALGEPDEVLEIRERAHPPPTLEVRHERWPGRREEHRTASPDVQVALAVRRVDRELRRCRRQHRGHHLRIEPHHHVVVHDGACLLEDRARLEECHPDPLIAQIAQRRRVEVRDLIVGQDPQRVERIDQMPVVLG